MKRGKVGIGALGLLVGLLGAVTNLGAQILEMGSESLLLDTVTGAATNNYESWIDPDGGDGLSTGSEVAALRTLVVSRADFLVTFTNTAFDNTTFEVTFFRGTNEFAWSIWEDPSFSSEFRTNSPELTMQALGGNRWQLSVNLAPFVWGTNRVVSIRAVPIDSTQPFARLRWLTKAAAPPGVRTWTADPDGNMTARVRTAAMRLWTKPVLVVGPTIRPFDEVTYEVNFPQGVLLGESQNGSAGPWDFRSTDGMNGALLVDKTENPMGFYRVIPDNL